MKWATYTMQELINEISMGPFGSDIKKSVYTNSGVPVLNGSNLQGFTLKENTFGYVSEEKADSLKKCNAHRGDIIVTHRGTLGQIVYIPNNSLFERYVISQSQFRFNLKPELARAEFIVYYFHTREGQHKILSNASQVGVPALARATTTFRQLEVKVPPLPVQDKIVGILSALDSKIENNNKINANLEAQAQALFKSWFVDFTPFKDQPFVDSELGPIPQGWKVGKLTDIAVYLNGLAMQKFPPQDIKDSFPVLKIKELGAGICDNSSDRCSNKVPKKYIIEDGDIIFSWSGTLMVDVWCGGQCGLNQHLFKVSSSNYPKWFYYHWTKKHLRDFIHIARDKAVTMGHIKRGHLDNALVVVPNNFILEKATHLFEPLLNMVISKRIENQRLAALRDTLLPKLMSGEIKL